MLFYCAPSPGFRERSVDALFSLTGIAMAVPQRVLRVLLAEDMPDHQQLVVYILGRRGHSVDIAEDGGQAVCMAQENCYDVILMDVRMSGMDVK